MNFKLDTNCGLPIYLQLIEQIKDLILRGALKPGDRLPSVRDLAVELRVNPNTVARTYRELQVSGVIDSRWGDGNFISDKTQALAGDEKKKIVRAAVESLVAQARDYGLADNEIRTILQESMAKPKKTNS